MRGKREKLLLFCMLLLLSAGVLMPYAASFLQDYKLASQRESRLLDSIELSLGERGVEETLAILSSGYTQIMLQEGKNLTQQEAEEAAKEAIQILTEEGLLPRFTIKSAKPPNIFAAISKGDVSNSAVIWGYAFTDAAHANCIVWIDDNTKKMVSVSYLPSEQTSFKMFEVASNKGYLIERWMAFLQEYYGLARVSVLKSDNTESGNTVTMELTWMDEKHTMPCQLPMIFRGEAVIFCW